MQWLIRVEDIESQSRLDESGFTAGTTSLQFVINKQTMSNPATVLEYKNILDHHTVWGMYKQ